MVKWKISEAHSIDDNTSEVFILNPNFKNVNKDDLKTLIDNDGFKFSLVYCNSKMVGYHFEYTNPHKERHIITNRMISWFFDGEKKDPQVSVLFEDQNIRLLSFLEKNSDNKDEKLDYWLVGRWRDAEAS